MINANTAKMVSVHNAPQGSVVREWDDDVVKISSDISDACLEGKYRSITFFKPWELSADRVSALIEFISSKGYRVNCEEITMGRPMLLSVAFRIEWD